MTRKQERTVGGESGINLKNEQTTPDHTALRATIMHLCLTGCKISIQVSLEKVIVPGPGPGGSLGFHVSKSWGGDEVF